MSHAQLTLADVVGVYANNLYSARESSPEKFAYFHILKACAEDFSQAANRVAKWRHDTDKALALYDSGKGLFDGEDQHQLRAHDIEYLTRQRAVYESFITFMQSNSADILPNPLSGK